jgi:hypothetical protein
MRNLILKSVLLAAGFIAGSAQALVIDFTDLDLWSVSSNTSSKTVSYGDLDVTITAYREGRRGRTYYSDLNTTAYDGQTPCEDFGGVGLDCESDGVGIGRYDDEIGAREWLSIEFSEAVDIASITFLDLFAYSGSDPQPEGAEVYSLDSDGEFEFGKWKGTANNDHTGFLDATVNNGLTTDLGIFDDVTMLFFTAGCGWCNCYSDYSVAAVELLREVPEPGTWVLLGVGLVSLVVTRRQQQKKA